MNNFFVSGLTNIETTLKIEKFPLEYFPVNYCFNDVNTTVSGVGVNVACNLKNLGADVLFASILGDDFNGELALKKLSNSGFNTEFIINIDHTHTAQSIILYDYRGKRQIHVDLKNIQNLKLPDYVYNSPFALEADFLIMCNINFSRPFTTKPVKGLKACDVHAISDINDDYNNDFMKNSDILFQSHENLPCLADDWIKLLWDKFKTPIAVVGCGADGAVLGEYSKKEISFVPAFHVEKIVNTVGAGDALFSSFLYYYSKNNDPVESLVNAVKYAGLKIQKNGGAAV